MIKKVISVTSHALDPLPQTVTLSRNPYPLERDVLYGRPSGNAKEELLFNLLAINDYI